MIKTANLNDKKIRKHFRLQWKEPLQDVFMCVD